METEKDPREQPGPGAPETPAETVTETETEKLTETKETVIEPVPGQVTLDDTDRDTTGEDEPKRLPGS